jgi:hypothetical protein
MGVALGAAHPSTAAGTTESVTLPIMADPEFFRLLTTVGGPSYHEADVADRVKNVGLA